MDVKKEVKEVMDYVIEKRRYFHENPEVSMKEYKTSKYLKEELKQYDLEIIETDDTAFYAIYDSKKEGKVIGLRTDIDALPVLESDENMTTKKVAVSKNEGYAHMCGHDGHMAMMLGTIKTIMKNKDKISGKLVFIFESGEEVVGGIYGLVESMKNIKFDAIFGMHVYSGVDTGKILVKEGPIMAGITLVDFDVIGQAGHGSRPDLAKSPIFAGANIVNQLASCFVNQLDVTKTVTLGLGKFISGTADNIIPEKAKITGSLRYFDEEEGRKAREIFKKTIENITNITGCTYEIHKLDQFAGPVINDNKLAKIVQNGLTDMFGDCIIDNDYWFASETFALYSKISPIVLLLVGARNREKGIYAEHHNERFDIDEDALYYGVSAAVRFIMDMQ